MPDFASVSAVLSSLKHATDVAKLIKDSGATLAAAEQKLKLAELIEALADAKMAMADLKGELQSKNEEVERLKRDAEERKTLVHNGLFYTKEGDPTPFCPRCFESDGKVIHLSPETTNGGLRWRRCAECEENFFLNR